MNIEPLRNYILLEYVAEDTAEGGIIIPEGTKLSNKLSGVYARAVGPEVKGINVGDRLVTNAYSGLGFEDEGKKFILVRQEDVLAIIR